MENKFVYYCQNCHKAYSREDGFQGTCPGCGHPLVNTKLMVSLWKWKSEEEKQKQKLLWDETDFEEKERFKQEKALEKSKRLVDEINKQSYSLDTVGEYEYDIVSLDNSSDGRVNTQSLKDILNTKAKEGWRLSYVYSNILGSNAIRIMNSERNATLSEDILVFERRIR